MKFKYILSDLDGVIRELPREKDLAIVLKHNREKGIISRSAFEKTHLEHAVCGIINDERWRAGIHDNCAKTSIGSR